MSRVVKFPEAARSPTSRETRIKGEGTQEVPEKRGRVCTPVPFFSRSSYVPFLFSFPSLFSSLRRRQRHNRAVVRDEILSCAGPNILGSDLLIKGKQFIYRVG